ncbi:MAG: inositol monophosphatase family protein [Candidatus Caldarchaeales archaeon]
MSIASLLKIVEDALVSAREHALESIRSGWGLKIKGLGAYGDKSYGFDLAAERAVIDVINDRLSNVAIISEELGISGSKDPDYYVLIDPIDGSRNASRGIPLFSTTIVISKSISSKDILVGGVIDHSNGDLYIGEKDGNVIAVGKKPSLTKTNSLSDAFLIVNTFSIRSEKYRRWGEMIINRSYVSLFLGTTALEICYILSGRVDGYVCLGPHLRPLDFIAPIFLLKLSGGSYTILTEDGEVDEINLSAGKSFGVIATSNKELFNEITKLREESQS